MPASTPFRVEAIEPDQLDRIRARGEDDFGNPVVRLVDHEAGAPLRCCLRDSVDGEDIALIAHQPSKIGGPYAEVGPVFIHADGCAGYAAAGYPEGFRHRRQLLRAYDADGWQVDNTVVEGRAAEAGIEQLLARPDVAFVHSRNLMAGCFMFRIVRA
jgi:hypothetical protein